MNSRRRRPRSRRAAVVDNRLFETDLFFLYANPRNVALRERIVEQYIIPLCTSLHYQFHCNRKSHDYIALANEDVIQEGIIECLHRILPASERRKKRDGQPVPGYIPGKRNAFSWFRMVAKNRMADYRKGCMRRVTREFKYVESAMHDDIQYPDPELFEVSSPECVLPYHAVGTL